MSDFGLLRAIRHEELPTMLTWRNTPSIRANMYTRHEISLQEHLAWWNRICECTDQLYLMYERNDVPQGIVGYTQIDRVNNNCSWAFYASPDAPRGTGSCMELLALDHAFDTMHLRKLYCEVLEFNKAVIKLHLKFGFQSEGVFRAQHLYAEKYIDIHRLGILAEEWSAQRHHILPKLQSARGN